MSEYLSQTAIGTRFGVSSHVVGRWLHEIGLRTSSNAPTTDAIDGGYCTRKPTGRGEGYYFWVWDADLTLRALERAGHEQVEEPCPMWTPLRAVM